MILFLDIDGVLNKHKQHPNGYCGIDKKLADNLLSAIKNTECKGIVISSAWRYLIINKSMTLKGFRNLLLTHGVDYELTEMIIGHTKADNSSTDSDRGAQIADWLRRNNYTHNIAVVVDDLDLQISRRFKFVRTKSNQGLTKAKAKQLRQLLLK